ncbi:MAG TPA: phenylalanine--tRNA ligase subunit beta [Eubacteriaceae bacterium]|nr:phenylalanine--tRNA ligase subunit beta [Eubacteriaceae bacterium]
MNTSLEWINAYTKVEDIATDEFIDAMTMSGTKVEGLEVLGEGIEKVVVSQVLSIEKHPDADKLVVCQVTSGEQTHQIVTGASNLHVGDKVPLALVGAKLAGGMKIKKSKLRGVESQGMLCSADELGMNTALLEKKQVEGIYQLPRDVVVGADAKEAIGLNDRVAEFEITANRPDCHSVLGIAREVAATFDRPFQEVEPEVQDASEEKIEDYLKVAVDNKDACKRYVARMMKVKKIEASPSWMAKRLLNSGIRPINNIVDVTNYVMLEFGQPLHAFDYNSLETGEIVVRNAKAGEKIVTLDGNERTLYEDTLVITNGRAPVAIAGVMGGENSDIEEDTKTIVIESANFDKNSVRMTSKKLNFRTDSSTKFEKGLDPNISVQAAKRAMQLLMEIDACEPIEGEIDVKTALPVANKVTVDPDWVNRFIGIDLAKETMVSYLNRLQLDTQIVEGQLDITVPTFRQDLWIKEDIAEEIARLYGYNNIDNTILVGEATEGGLTERQKFEKKCKSLLVYKNHYEILTYSFTSEGKLMDLNIEKNDPVLQDSVALINPLGEENKLMRTTLLPGLLQVISHNYNRNIPEGGFFEMAVNYMQNKEANDLPIERKKISIGHYGKGDFFTMKGVVELVLEAAKIPADSLRFVEGGNSWFHPKRKAQIFAGDQYIGEFGEAHPKVCKNYDLPKRTYIAELDVESLWELSDSTIAYRALARYPGVVRDLAFLVKEDVKSGDIVDVIKKQGGSLLSQVKLFDVYQGEQVEKEHKSLAYSLSFQADDRTLKDEEINQIIEKILEECEQKLGAKLRD